MTPSNWWCLRDLLDEAELALLEGDEILDEVEEPRRPARALDQRVEADDARFLLVVDPLPLVEKFERRIGRAKDGFEPVRQDHEGVRREDMRDRRAIVGEIAVIGVGHRLVARLQLDEQQRQAVDEADEIGALGVKFAGEPDLRGKEKIVRVRVLPVDHANDLGLALAVLAADLHGDALAQKVMDLGIRANSVDCAALASQRRIGVFERRVGQGRIELFERAPQPLGQDDVALRGAPFGAARHERIRRTDCGSSSRARRKVRLRAVRRDRPRRSRRKAASFAHAGNRRDRRGQESWRPSL